MSDLAEFLLERIAEDEAIARAAIGTAAFQRQTGHWSFEDVPAKYGVTPIVFAVADGGGKTQVANLAMAWERNERGAHIARFDPARILAECDAKRRIIELHSGPHNCENVHTGQVGWNVNPCTTLELLALPYADHPDYQQEWKP